MTRGTEPFERACPRGAACRMGFSTPQPDRCTIDTCAEFRRTVARFRIGLLAAEFGLVGSADWEDAVVAGRMPLPPDPLSPAWFRWFRTERWENPR